MGPVGPPAHLGRPVDLDVLDDEVVGVQPLVLGVALRILQHVQKEFSGLVGPPAEEERFHKSDRQCCGSGSSTFLTADPG